jgi:Spy/CpxP family protein refolding chaperone
MKTRNIIALCVIGLLVMGTVVAHAQKGMRHLGGLDDKPVPNARCTHKGLHELLELTPEQVKQIKDARIEMKKRLIPLQADLKLAQLELAEMVRDGASKGELDKKIDDIGAIRSSMQKIRVSHRLEFRNLLTDEQKNKLESMPGGWHGFCRGHDMSGGHRGGRGAGFHGGRCPFTDDAEFHHGRRHGPGDCFWLDDGEI